MTEACVLLLEACVLLLEPFDPSLKLLPLVMKPVDHSVAVAVISTQLLVGFGQLFSAVDQLFLPVPELFVCVVDLVVRAVEPVLIRLRMNESGHGFMIALWTLWSSLDRIEVLLAVHVDGSLWSRGLSGWVERLGCVVGRRSSRAPRREICIAHQNIVIVTGGRRQPVALGGMCRDRRRACRALAGVDIRWWHGRGSLQRLRVGVRRWHGVGWRAVELLQVGEGRHVGVRWPVGVGWLLICERV